uniref:Kelch-like protein 12 n=1 Tax=Phallusia mammillata TaxID=59560 RepID=A0A6F9DGN9_9ASCI|nr:kelch-like protein 12 [Phallusia mammillata]
MKEKYSQTVRLNEVSADVFEQVLDFIYTGKIMLTDNNVNDIMKTASLLLVENLLNIIGEYLAETLDSINALQLRETSRLFSLHKLEEKVKQCIAENFGVVSTQKKFTETSEEDLNQYLLMDEINASEDELVSCLLNWTKADLSSRQEKFLSLFKLIRLQRVSVEYLVNTLRNDPLVKRNHECRDLIEEAMHFHLKPEGIEKQVKRQGKGKQATFLLTSGNSIEKISMDETTEMEEITQPPMHVSHNSAVVLHGDKLFFFGGFNPNENVASNSIVSFDGSNWKKEGKMKYSRSNASAVSIQGDIYIFCGDGNGNGGYVLQTEKFSGGRCVVDPQKQSNYQRIHATSVAMGDFVFTIGGRNYSVNETTTRINIKDGEKFDGHKLNYRRYSFGVCVAGSKIFVCGGLDERIGYIPKPVNTFEFLDTTNINNNTPWTIVQQHPPYQLGQTSALLFGDDQMLVLGESNDNLYCFDCTTSQWKLEIDTGEEMTNQQIICKLGTATRGSKLFKF